MFSVKIAVKTNGKLAQLKMSAREYREIGEVMLDSMKLRILKGINADGQKASPLSPAYARIKAEIRNTRRPIRDMFLSGMTLNDYRVRKAHGGQIVCEPASTEAQKRAILAQRIEPMFGFTNAEEKAVVKHVRQIYGRHAQVLWKSTKTI